MIGYIPQTKTRKVSVVPKSAGSVSPDATLCPNPWGQKSPGVGGWVALITPSKPYHQLLVMVPCTLHAKWAFEFCWRVRSTWPLGLALTTISLMTGPWFIFPWRTHEGIIGYTPQTKTRQVSVVPKSVGLVSPDASLCPNPWGQKSPTNHAGHPSQNRKRWVLNYLSKLKNTLSYCVNFKVYLILNWIQFFNTKSYVCGSYLCRRRDSGFGSMRSFFCHLPGPVLDVCEAYYFLIFSCEKLILTLHTIRTNLDGTTTLHYKL